MWYTIPTFIAASPSGGITPQILVDLMKHLDHYAYNDLRLRFPGVTPVPLLDGHGSRFDPAFINYITDPDHRWAACGGVPNWTNGWQAGDAEQVNGHLQTEAVKEKRAIMEVKQRLCMPPTLQPTDVAPIVSKITDRVFSNKDGIANACADRGTGLALTYNLLDHPDIVASRMNLQSEAAPTAVTAPDSLVPAADCLPTKKSCTPCWTVCMPPAGQDHAEARTAMRLQYRQLWWQRSPARIK